MNIHFYINTSFPFGMAAAKRRLCYAKGLMAAGDNVDIIICQKCFEKNNNDGLPIKGIYQGIPYNYVCGKFKHTKKHRLLRGLDYFVIDYIRSFLYALFHIKKNDVVYVYFYPIFLQILILIATKIKQAKIVKETCEHPAVFGNINSKWYRFCKYFEFKLIMPKYNGFIAISRELNKFVNRYKSPTAKCIIVPILVDDPFVYKNKSSLINEYEVPYILHTGTMYEQKDSISKILYAFARFKRENNSKCRLVFTGPQANDKCEYLPLMEKLGIKEDVDLLGIVDADRVISLQYFAAMTIIYKSDNLQTRNCFPTKLGEMLICGVPVITTTVGDANMYLQNGKNALIIEPNDEKSLVNDIKFILNNQIEAKKIGNAGRIIAEKYFNPIYQGIRISDFLRSL